MKANKVQKGQMIMLPGYEGAVEVLEIRDHPNQGYLEFRCNKNVRHTALYDAHVTEATPESLAIALLQKRDRDAIIDLKGIGEVTADKILAINDITVVTVKEVLGEADWKTLVKNFE